MGYASTRLPPLRPIAGRHPRDVLRIAHRGGANGAEDYSVANLHAIGSLGAHLVELDLHVTRDDQLVVHHDPALPLGAGPWWIADHTAEQLRALVPESRVPSASTVIRATREAGLGLYADIKTISAVAVASLVAVLHDEGMAERVILASARSDIVAMCSQVAPELPRSVLFASVHEEPVQLAQSVRADFVHPCWEVQPRPDQLLAGPWLARVRERGLGVICWHEERPEVVKALYALGVDGICTDEPPLLTQIASNS